ncbi:MAG: putative adhesin [Candidatus Parcubacteria bacterium]|jgi:hypothetical protein
MKKLISVTLVIFGFILGATALSAIAAWSVPACTPPSCNTEAPINASSSPQTKLGPLTLNFDNIYAVGLKVLGSMQIVDGNQGAGKVLTSDAIGVGTWQPSGKYRNEYTAAGTHEWRAPAGVTSVYVMAWGGGAGGVSGTLYSGGGAGGGGGGHVRGFVTVVPETKYTITVGAGGANSGTYPYSGGSSTFSTIVAEGGNSPLTSSYNIGGIGGGGSGGDVVAGKNGTNAPNAYGGDSYGYIGSGPASLSLCPGGPGAPGGPGPGSGGGGGKTATTVPSNPGNGCQGQAGKVILMY